MATSIASHKFAHSQLIEHGLRHLQAYSHGRHVVVYSQETGGDKFPRIRFTALGPNRFRLDVATHTGRWESTPYVGMPSDLAAQVMNDFSWLLADL